MTDEPTSLVEQVRVKVSDMTPWIRSHRFDPIACKIADRHYNRQKVGSPQFVPPGRCLVMRTFDGDAFWVTSWPFAEFTKHAWPGAWICSAFRNESEHLSSEMIVRAVAHTRSEWEPPDIGMVTFVDRSKVRSKRDPGYCYLMAGFKPCGRTKGGLVALQMLPPEMPDAEPLPELQMSFAALTEEDR